MQAESLDLLTRNRIFAGCPPEVLGALSERGSLSAAPRGTKIAEAGKPFPFVGLVSFGTVGVMLRDDGTIRGVQRWQMYASDAGNIFGGAAFLAAQSPPGDILVISKQATYALFPVHAIEAAIAADPRLLRRLAQHVASRLMEVGRRVIRSKRRPVPARVASVLLRFAADGEGLQPGKRGLVEITQRDIAADASCVTESAARAIANLEHLGALTRRHGHIVKLDRKRLLQCAKVLIDDRKT